MLSGPRHIPPHLNAALILCHGYGSNGDDLFDLSPGLSAAFPGLGVFCPNAPTPILAGGFEWFNLDDYPAQDTPDYIARLEKRAQPAVAAVQELAAHIITEYRLPANRIFIGGFSQGGQVALLAALTYPRKLAGCIGMSALPIATPAAFQDIPVLLTHGDADDVVPPAALDMTQNALNHRAEVFIAPGMAHAINGACVQKITAWMQKILDARD